MCDNDWYFYMEIVCYNNPLCNLRGNLPEYVQ